MSTSRTPAADSAIFLGLDFGTSGARASLVDAAGRELWHGALPFTRNDWQEWREVLFALLAAIPAEMRQYVHAVVFCGTSATSLLCNGAGVPVAPALLYNDGRALDEAQTVRNMAGTDTLAAAPTSSLPKLLWLIRHSGHQTDGCFMHQADWLASLLHGCPGVSDYHNALKLGYDVERQEYPDWLAASEYAHLLPRVTGAGTDVAMLAPEVAAATGLPEHCVVRAGTTDSIAAFIASGARHPGQAVTSLGSTLVLKLLSRHRVEAPQYGVYSHRYGNMWLAGGASNCGGKLLDTLFGKSRLAALSARLDPDHPTGLDYYPLPSRGERFPYNDPEMQPRLSPRPDDPAVFLQGLLESLARIETQGYRLLENLGATPASEVLTAGGGASNPAWTAIRQRSLGIPVSAAPQTEAAYGAALLAARGKELLYCTPA